MTAVTISLLVVTILTLSFVAHRIVKDAPDKTHLARLRCKEGEIPEMAESGIAHA
jgi:hypothetical protein